jgi:hypothetical protein
MNIVETAKKLSEIVAASSLIECATESNIVEEFSALCKLECNAYDWVLASIFLLPSSLARQA